MGYIGLFDPLKLTFDRNFQQDIQVGEVFQNDSFYLFGLSGKLGGCFSPPI